LESSLLLNRIKALCKYGILGSCFNLHKCMPGRDSCWVISDYNLPPRNGNTVLCSTTMNILTIMSLFINLYCCQTTRFITSKVKLTYLNRGSVTFQFRSAAPTEDRGHACSTPQL
jgi:hypothetical protein